MGVEKVRGVLMSCKKVAHIHSVEATLTSGLIHAGWIQPSCIRRVRIADSRRRILSNRAALT